MHKPVISATGVFTPNETITNDELVLAFNAYADLYNVENADAIAAGELPAKDHSSSDFINKASGIEQRYVLNKSGILDPKIMHPVLRERSDDEPSQMAEMAVAAARIALDKAGVDAAQVDLILVAASNHERAYPAIAVEVQALLGAAGFGYDMNVACSSATFGIQSASDMIRVGSVRKALVINPEICSAHLEWRDRDCHFIFGDVATATLLERKEDVSGPHFDILSSKCATQFSNNIRNNNGFLRKTRAGHMEDRRDMQFMQNGRAVFKEVLPMVSKHILDQLVSIDLQSSDLTRLWLHQANKTMNDFIGRKVMGRNPETHEQPNILQDYANTSSAGSIIAFSKYCDDMVAGQKGVICSFGAGYSVGSIVVERAE
jgi:beta-ketodecanoyl-[acyl-carrier-protein] synthase